MMLSPTKPRLQELDQQIQLAKASQLVEALAENYLLGFEQLSRSINSADQDQDEDAIMSDHNTSGANAVDAFDEHIVGLGRFLRTNMAIGKHQRDALLHQLSQFEDNVWSTLHPGSIRGT